MAIINVKLDGTARSANELYRAYNICYFDGKLNPDIKVRFGKTGKEHALGQYSMFMESTTGSEYKLEHEIVLDPVLKKLRRIMGIVLLHEMCHIATPGDDHGKKFQAERRRLVLMGAYDNLL